jgi:hypothetical protein
MAPWRIGISEKNGIYIYDIIWYDLIWYDMIWYIYIWLYIYDYIILYIYIHMRWWNVITLLWCYCYGIIIKLFDGNLCGSFAWIYDIWLLYDYIIKCWAYCDSMDMIRSDSMWWTTQ